MTEDEPTDSAKWSEVDALLKEGNKIEAIKVHREATGLGLKESKEAVEKRLRELANVQPGILEANKGGCMGVVLMAVSLASLAIGWMAVLKLFPS